MSLQRPPKIGKGVYSTGGSKSESESSGQKGRRSLYVKIFFGLQATRILEYTWTYQSTGLLWAG